MSGELIFAIGYGLAMVLSGAIAYWYTKRFYDVESKQTKHRKD